MDGRGRGSAGHARIVSQYGEGKAEFHVRQRTAEVVEHRTRDLCGGAKGTAMIAGTAPRAGYLHARAGYLRRARDLTQLCTRLP